MSSSYYQEIMCRKGTLNTPILGYHNLDLDCLAVDDPYNELLII